MTQPSTLEMLRAMQGDDLVRFERDIVDKRKNRVYLTERALELKVPLLRVAEEVNKATLQRLSAAEQALLKILLKSVRDTSSEELKKQAQAELIENAFALNLRREELIGPGNKSRTVDE
jgi:DNA-binding MarR family transcriptional regulator